MSLIIFGRQENAHVHSDDHYDIVFGHGLYYEQQLINEMVEPILNTQGVKDAEYTWYLFEYGKRFSPEKTDELIAKATAAANELQLTRQKKLEEEMAAKAEEAKQRQDAIDRRHYEELKRRFEPAKESS